MTDLEQLVDTLLYEGYALYPYTPGATKNATPTPFGIVYPAEEIARGAAYELFSAEPADGFVRDVRTSARLRYRRVVHVTEVDAVHGEPSMQPVEREAPLMAPAKLPLITSENETVRTVPGGPR